MLLSFTVPSPVRSLTVAALLVLAPSSAFAGGAAWIVDANGGPGSHFTDIPPAIAVAQPNDRVFVRAGIYSGFVLDKPIVVRGVAGALVSDLVRIQNTPATTRCVVSQLEVPGLQVSGCAGGVVLERVRNWSPQNGLGGGASVLSSADVRMRACEFAIYDEAYDGDNGLNAVFVSAATLEIVSSTLVGQHGAGTQTNPAFGPGVGGAGVLANSASTLSVALSTLVGGGGGWAYFGAGREGGSALFLSGNSRARAAQSVLAGADGGFGSLGGCGGSFGDGRGGSAIRAVTSSMASHSALTASSGWGWDCGQASLFAVQSSGQIVLSTPARPTLQLVSANAAGAVTLRVSGPANSTARVWLGRTMITPAPNTDVVGLLTNRARIQNLGAVPAGGQVDAFFTLPSSVETGELVIAQADVLTSTGELLYSNSVCFTRP